MAIQYFFRSLWLIVGCVLSLYGNNSLSDENPILQVHLSESLLDGYPLFL